MKIVPRPEKLAMKQARSEQEHRKFIQEQLKQGKVDGIFNALLYLVEKA